jgi:alkylation response protein AidB-like acyl-CoA dehydrogenase
LNLSYPPDVLRFAEDVRAFVRAELPENVRDRVQSGQMPGHDEQIAWQRKLLKRGWAAPGWPVEYGGQNWSALQHHMFNEVMTEEGAPAPVPFGQNMLAPIIVHVGTEAQKDHYLPRILSLEYWFCQGYSEPGAGSDLASLKTSAVLDGDEWVVNGQKTWTSGAHYANMMFALVRTDPKAEKPQAGISLLVFPMATPGICVRPIITLNGEHTVNEVFFDNVRVPKDSLIGEVNKGWTYGKMLLGHERAIIGGAGQARRALKRLKEAARRVAINGVPLIETQSFRDKIAEAEIELKSLEMLNLRMIVGEGKNAPGTEANMIKIKGSELQQRIAELTLEAVGPEALARGNDQMSDAVRAAPAYLMGRVLSIFGGSNEIQRNILAKSLGL